MKKITLSFQKSPSSKKSQSSRGLTAGSITKIFIGNNYLHNLLLIQYCKKLGNQIVIICDANVKKLFGNDLLKHFKKNKIKANLISFKAGEKNKTRKTKEKIETEMLRLGCGKDTCIVALGGGITTDLAGFIASTYQRGVPVIYIPTTLLAMVDASIGGKTGINTAFGKNLIGTFYQPNAVFIDTACLKTLPKNEFKNGLVEMIKHAIIADQPYFSYLIKNKKAIVSLKNKPLEKAIEKSCLIKKNIIEQDEKDIGIRQLLNFGHTIGHALEQASHYQLSHGEAVARGMITESNISVQLKLLSQSTLDKIKSIFNLYEIPIKLNKNYNKNTIKKALLMDKKNIQQIPRFVLIRDIGKPYVTSSSSRDLIAGSSINCTLDTAVKPRYDGSAKMLTHIKQNEYTSAVPDKIINAGLVAIL